MSRDAPQVRESRWHDRWARFVRGVKRIVTVVSLICIAALVGLLTQRATDMPVQHIAIAGDMRHIEPASLEAIIKPHVADGFLLADLRSIRQQLEGLSWVHAASVRREWPDTIRVTITEQQPIARWGDAAYINQQGLIFEGDMMPRYAELPMLWSEHRKPSFLIEHFKLFQTLLLPYGLAISGLTQDKLGQVQAELTDGTQVQFGDRDFAQRVRRFAALLDSEVDRKSIARIDFRYERGAAILRRASDFRVTAIVRKQGGQ